MREPLPVPVYPADEAEADRRLARLGEIVAAAPAVDLSDWCRKPREGDPPQAHACGTVACALGWACLAPEFQALGLRLGNGFGSTAPEFAGLQGFTAGAAFFGISWGEAAGLFSPVSGYVVTDREVFARRLADLMALRRLRRPIPDTCRAE